MLTMPLNQALCNTASFLGVNLMKICLIVFDNKGNRGEKIWKMNKLGTDNETFPKIIRLLVLNLENE
jgi:hypothetical protein